MRVYAVVDDALLPDSRSVTRSRCSSVARDVGRAVKWWFPGRCIGLHHKNRALEEWKRSQPEGALE